MFHRATKEKLENEMNRLYSSFSIASLNSCPFLSVHSLMFMHNDWYWWCHFLLKVFKVLTSENILLTNCRRPPLGGSWPFLVRWPRVWDSRGFRKCDMQLHWLGLMVSLTVSLTVSFFVDPFNMYRLSLFWNVRRLNSLFWWMTLENIYIEIYWLYIQ